MTISRDLMLAILAMDSYNREYDQNMSTLPDTGRLGNVNILRRQALGIDADAFTAWKAAGFYAIAYDVSQANIAGLSGTVIAYRGTNFNPNWGAFFGGPLWADMRNGWLAGAGFAVEQSKLALDFYGAVAGTADRRSAAITTTGHSLGGGLAGMAARRIASERPPALATPCRPRRLARAGAGWRRSRQVALPLPNAFMAHGCNIVRRR